MITIMQIVTDGHGATGEELLYVLGKELERFNNDALLHNEKEIVINKDKKYTHEEILDFGMMLSADVRKYVIVGEKKVKDHVEEEVCEMLTDMKSLLCRVNDAIDSRDNVIKRYGRVVDTLAMGFETVKVNIESDATADFVAGYLNTQRVIEEIIESYNSSDWHESIDTSAIADIQIKDVARCEEGLCVELEVEYYYNQKNYDEDETHRILNIILEDIKSGVDGHLNHIDKMYLLWAQSKNEEDSELTKFHKQLV